MASRPTPTAGRPRADPRRRLGRIGEDIAAAHLQRRGLAILARNVRTRDGEIDMIAFANGTLVFVEVKTRRARRASVAGDELHAPLAGLGLAQRRRLRRLASAWLASGETRPAARTIRFDAIGVTLDERGRLRSLEHLEGAW
jgi:putative endonuclease